MNLLKNIFIDILGKRNNNVLFNTWNAKEKTCITNLNGSYDLLIFDFDNRLGDSIYLALFISEIS